MAVVKDEHSRMLTIDVDLNDVKPLTNFEVYEFVKMRMESKDKVRAQQTILYTTMRYFNEKSPCTCQAVDEIDSFVESMRKFNLNTSELLALINNCPTTQAELSVMISDLDTRFSMSQVEEILTVISNSFPRGTERASQVASSGICEESTD